MKVLVTGGAGYIGSHTAIELLAAGHQVVIVDNLENSSAEAVRRIENIAGKTVDFIQLDVSDKPALRAVFTDHAINAAIHFAGLKAVGESVAEPLRYYRQNIGTTLTLCEVMQEFGVRQLIFSSSATVYGAQQTPEYTEDMSYAPVNPYGHTKAMIEQILRDACGSDKGWQVTALRYFNPVGAHPSGQIGEDPLGVPNNLFPYVAQVAIGKREALTVYGDDYETPDGTGVRDYIHVVDLAKGHVAALEHAPAKDTFTAYNLGSGTGSSVLEVLQAFKTASGKAIPHTVVERRAGDLAIYYANPAKAERELGWHTERSLADACTDTWRWQSQNPNGFKA